MSVCGADDAGEVIMTRSKTRAGTVQFGRGCNCGRADRDVRCAVPTEFTRIPFPVKALKILLRELQSGGEAASRRMNASELGSDDGVSFIANPLYHRTLTNDRIG